MMSDELQLTEEEWKARLSPERFNVIREKGTEPPFSGPLLHNKENGVYTCSGCGQELFRSSHKFDSGSGWPSFFDVIDHSRIRKERDESSEMTRVEISCSRCGGHLGHLFDDGPNPTGLRYCVNSLSLVLSKGDRV